MRSRPKAISVIITSVFGMVIVSMAAGTFNIDYIIESFGVKEPYASYLRYFYGSINELVGKVFSILKDLSNNIFKSDSVVNKVIKTFEESGNNIPLPLP